GRVQVGNLVGRGLGEKELEDDRARLEADVLVVGVEVVTPDLADGEPADIVVEGDGVRLELVGLGGCQLPRLCGGLAGEAADALAPVAAPVLPGGVVPEPDPVLADVPID